METHPEEKFAEIQEQSEKEIAWDKQMQEVEKIKDAMGYGIDSGVKETIAACNLLEIPTSASCEGHSDSGFNAPWIQIDAPNEPGEKHVGQNEVIQRVADKRHLAFMMLKE